MKRFLNLLLLVCAFSYTLAQTQNAFAPVLLTEAEYEQFTYDWTDANGVKHQNTKLTEKAESTEQIMALIAKVYGDPNIPGSWYGEPAKRQHATPYGDVKKNGWNITGQKPNTEGYTMLLVAVKDTWTNKLSTEFSNVKDYITEAIKWVKVIPNGVRVEENAAGPNHSGVMYNIDETLNRFYFMTKGRYRSYTEMPFLNMFELFSPTTDADGAETADFYKKMQDGEIYNVVHDCGSVESATHYFTMTGRKGTDSKHMTGLVFYISDYRFEWWSLNGKTRDSNHTLTWYNQSYAPQALMYTIKLQAEAERAETSDGSRKFDVTLTWTSSLNKVVPNSNLVQEYDIYPVINGVRQSTPIATGITGNSYTYQVPQELEGYDLTYQISGRPINTEFNKAWSNTDAVSIPGYDPFERLNLSIVGNYKSTYDQEIEVNDYENLITMTNNTSDLTTSLKGNMIDQNTRFELYRFDNEEDNPKMTLIATVQMAAKEKVSEGVWHFPYTISYNSRVRSVRYPSNSGYFTADSENGILDLGPDGLQFMDAFNASTMNNDHPDHYDYQVKFVSAIDIIAPDGTTGRDAYSNITRVPVYKTSIDVNVPVYSLQDVQADTDRHLDMSTVATIDMTLNNYGTVKDYLVRRNAANDIGIIQRDQDGSYTSFKRDDTGFNTVIETKTFGENKQLTMSLEDDGRNVTAATKANYVGIIEAYTEDNTNETVVSTYGSDIKYAEMANLDLELDMDKIVMSNMAYSFTPPEKYEVDGQNKSLYVTCLKLNASISDGLIINGPDNEQQAPYYRVWRVVDGVETLVDEGQKTYTLHNKLLTGPEATFERVYGGVTFDNENKTFTIQDSFLGRPLYQNAVNPVTYIARVYAQRPMDDGTEDDFYIAESRLTVEFRYGIHTGVDDITASSLLSVTYYNLQGIASSTPHSGYNIAVARYSDGSVKTSRMIK